MKTSDVRWSCSAQIDLLGFSNHLMVANWDVRTEAGALAIERLSSLEDAIKLFEREKRAYPELYPSELHYTRFNDALFLGIDAMFLGPPAGQTTLTGGCSFDQLKKMYPHEGEPIFDGTVVESGGNVAKFLGLVARIHKYVNERESANSFPGCRTVVASGLRKCFKDRQGNSDFFSANFSISMAYEAEKKGSSAGIHSNHLYVEDDIAVAISYCQPCFAILGFSKFFRAKHSLVAPYQYEHQQEGSFSFPSETWTIPDPISLEIFKKRLTFRQLNPTVLTNLQLFKDYQRVAIKDREFNREIAESLHTSTPSLRDVNNSSLPFPIFKHDRKEHKEYPFLSLEFTLDTEYSDFFGQEQ